MAQMDHNEAIQLQAAVKYVLGELSPVQREEYEEHYFACSECASDLKAAATFVDAAREVLRQETASTLAKDSVAARGGWLGWFQPVAAVPAFAALLLIIAYQNTVTIPHAREEASSGAAQLFVTSHAPKMAVTRGGEEGRLSVHPNDSLALKFDFTPKTSFHPYSPPLQSPSPPSFPPVPVPPPSPTTPLH